MRFWLLILLVCPIFAVQNNLWVLNGDGSIAVFSPPFPGGDITHIPASSGKTPVSMAAVPSQQSVYVANKEGTISVFSDSPPYTLQKTIQTPSSVSQIRSLLFNSAQNYLYESNIQDNTIFVYDVSKNTFVTLTIPADDPQLDGPAGMAIGGSTTSLLYVLNSVGTPINFIIFFDPTTNTFVGAVNGGGLLSQPTQIVMDPNQSIRPFAYIMNTGNSTITQFNTMHKVLGHAALLPNPPDGMTISLNGVVYVATGTGVYFIEPTTPSIASPIGTSTDFSNAASLTFNTVDGNVYVANEIGNYLTIISTSTEQIVGTISNPNLKNPFFDPLCATIPNFKGSPIPFIFIRIDSIKRKGATLMNYKNFLPSLILLSGHLFAGNNSSVMQTQVAYSDECWRQSEPLCGQYGPAYNAPAIIDVCAKSACNSWWPTGFFVDVSFLYWLGGSEGSAVAANGVLSGPMIYFATHTTAIYQSFDYKPGFKVKTGFIADHSWSLYAEYTWLRGTDITSVRSPTTNTTAGTSAATTGVPVFIVTDWFLNGTQYGQALPASSITSKWNYAVDLLDLSFSHPFYEGPRLILTPFGGLRSAIIRRKIIVELTQPSAVSPLGKPPQPIGSRNYSDSWSIGPRLGTDITWLLCYGLRIEGDLAASILYTRYTKLVHAEDPSLTFFNPGPYVTDIENYGCLRSMADLGIGIGWGRYVSNNRYHIDFGASYDFTYMFHQNMIHKLLDDVLTGTKAAASDMYFHGLSLTGRLDF